MKTEAKPIGKTHRELIVDLLGRLHAEADLTDEETLFSLIYADYESYASLIINHDTDVADAEARGRNARIEELITTAPPTDGIPALGASNNPCSRRRASIFDLARS